MSSDWLDRHTVTNILASPAMLRSARLVPLQSESMDLVVADPPWGQRHSRWDARYRMITFTIITINSYYHHY